MPCILYLVHNLDDPAVWRRVEMLEAGGAEVRIAGFRRGSGSLPRPAIELGRTANARMAQRVAVVLRNRLAMNPTLLTGPRPDVIMARNLEVLALAAPLRKRLAGRRPLPLVYEVLDIHGMMIGEGVRARMMRRVERRLCREVDRLIVSSPAFVENYFLTYGQCDAPVSLVENKVWAANPDALIPGPRDTSLTRPIRIGWFGVLRCRFSLHCLDAVTRAMPEQVTVSLRGRPALDEIPDFHSIIDANPQLEFGGPYAYPADLPDIYGDVDLAWLVDRYEAGANSEWLLPNRLYESGLTGVPPIGLNGTEIGHRIERDDIGLVLASATSEATVKILRNVTAETLQALQRRHQAIPRDAWVASEAECRELVRVLTGHSAATGPRPKPQTAEVGQDAQPSDRDNRGRAATIAGNLTTAPADAHGSGEPGTESVLVVVPTYNEVDHISGVIDEILPQIRRLGSGKGRLVIADGGSTDGTQAVVESRASAATETEVHLIHNSERLQGAGVNLAVARFGEGMKWLLRMDAHAGYPDDYLEKLLEDAEDTGADCVVVAMTAVGETALHRVIAVTQNSPIGNGGSAHRKAGKGAFVDHGHHALMRLEIFRSVGGYDKTFSHNEDAELDLRIGQAGHRIWLSGRTGLNYVPRRTLSALGRQYFNFGRGRARTLAKHRVRPRLRQLAMISLAPAVGFALAGLIVGAAGAEAAYLLAIPASLWLAACLVGGAVVAASCKDFSVLLAGPIAALMHFSWSIGYWQQTLAGPRPDTGSSASAPLRQIAPAAPGPVLVGICTFCRPEIIDTLESLETQILPEGVTISIVVADNETSPAAKSLVEEFAARSRHDVTYLHAPARNISIARNAILDTAMSRGIDRLAFLDDDERSPEQWISALLSRLAGGDCDVVVGPVRAVYEPDAPAWMRRRRIHDTDPELGPDGRPIAGHSCNVLMDLSSPPIRGLRFDLARGRTGGEDTAFFEMARRAGARLALSREAVLYERVPPERTRLGWLLKRRFRMGQTHGGLLKESADAVGLVRHFLVTLLKIAWCMGATAIFAFVEGRRKQAILRGGLHIGVLTALAGYGTVEIYGGDPKTSG
ncbi:glycosyltransferase [Wenxinia marina]|uniref:Putative glycosyltransferase n=1 Tax=Wenxinia marina DSM 24838 TaxID=1123501 RepID=A0A0D0QAE0_9RHOB|nr:glycosyltransferase [Wenxinia marina]KIQ69287.1 putative glycosyltransferase [Wenxinia marina DSM 24838]GGL71838.1 hypothetical protein GCM10011392_28040 [Wenxinia marina]